MKKQKQKTDVFEMRLEHRTHASMNSPLAADAISDYDAALIQESQEGQLAIDVLETPTHIVVVSTVAGAHPESLEIFVDSDLLTIRGERKNPLDNSSQTTYVHQECFWGKFSRTVVLPVHVKGDMSHATYKNGVLTVRIPKRSRDIQIPIEIVD